jgi:hypothetical protein
MVGGKVLLRYAVRAGHQNSIPFQTVENPFWIQQSEANSGKTRKKTIAQYKRGTTVFANEASSLHLPEAALNIADKVQILCIHTGILQY